MTATSIIVKVVTIPKNFLHSLKSNEFNLIEFQSLPWNSKAGSPSSSMYWFQIVEEQKYQDVEVGLYSPQDDATFWVIM